MGEDSTPIDLGSDQAVMWLTLQGAWNRWTRWQTPAGPTHLGGTSACQWECILSMTKTFRLQDKEGTWVSP